MDIIPEKNQAFMGIILIIILILIASCSIIKERKNEGVIEVSGSGYYGTTGGSYDR